MATTPLEFPAQIDFVHFVSEYAHDLRSPFNRMMGFLKIVLKGQDGPLTDLQKEDLNTVYQNSVYAFTMVSNLIDIARLIAGEKSLGVTETSIVTLLHQAVSQWQKYHADANPQVMCETHVAPDIAPLQADGILMAQAITGLVACVVESRKPPVLVSITVKETPNGLVFTILGAGQPAYNPSQLDLDSYGFISQALIALHHGKLQKQETGDEGALIEFVLPRG